MKVSEILFEAARLMNDSISSGCCSAVNTAASNEDYILYEQAFDYLAMFEPSNCKKWSYWFGETRLRGTDKNVHVRVMALLFAAALAEAEGN